MRMRHGAVALLAATLLLGCAPPGPPAAPVTIREMASAQATASGQPIRWPAGDGHLLLAEYRIAPGARLPVHRHPHPRYAIVQAGTLGVTAEEGGQTRFYRTGDLIVEMVGQWHSALNSGAEEVVLLVLDALPAGAGPNTVLRP